MIHINGYLICSPPRTGTESLQRVCRLHGGKRIGGKHRSLPIRGLKATRVLVVREPYPRLHSMWRYFQAMPYSWGCRGMSWTRFLDHFFERRAFEETEHTQQVTRNQVEFAERFQPDHVCRLEDGLEAVMELVKAPVFRPVRRMNHIDGCPGDDVFDIRCQQWAAPDLEEWYT